MTPEQLEHKHTYDKAYYVKNRERCLQVDKEWRKHNQEHRRNYRVIYRQKYRVAYLLGNARRRARKHNLEFSITASDIVIPKLCSWLGTPICHCGKPHCPNSPSLDRTKSDKGYTPDNIEVISYRANTLKKDMTLDEIISMGKRAQQLKRKNKK